MDFSNDSAICPKKILSIESLLEMICMLFAVIFLHDSNAIFNGEVLMPGQGTLDVFALYASVILSLNMRIIVVGTPSNPKIGSYLEDDKKMVLESCPFSIIFEGVCLLI
jgi:hypothetical protein